MSETAVARQRWFFGPVPDLLLGCGLVYLAFFAAQAVAGPELRAAIPLTLLPLLTLALGAPHYGATLLRVYETRESRHRYFLFAVHATLLLAIAYLAGLHVPWLGSLIVTVYLTWSPWHYSAQNYGVAALFLARGGIPLDAWARRLLHGSFVLSYLMVFLAIHSPTSTADYAPAGYRGTLFDFVKLGIPTAIGLPATIAAELGWMACVIGFLWVMVPRASLRQLGPALMLILLQALWFALPTLAIRWGAFQNVEPLRDEFRVYAFMWIAVGHFVQYLWITSFFAAASQRAAGRMRYLGKTLLAGSALWVAPTLLFAPAWFGGPSFSAGLGLLTASIVNIHHFVLDGVIWKMRDGWLSRNLLRRVDTLPPPSGTRRIAWVAPAVWALGALCVTVSFALKADVMLASAALERGDVRRMSQAYDRRAWIGRDDPDVRLELARSALRARDLEGARAELARAVALGPSAGALVLQARIEEMEGHPERALELYEAVLRLAPEHKLASQRRAALRTQVR